MADKMPPNRRPIQQAHERSVVATFINEINRRHRARYQVVAEPNPPEAIIQSAGKTSWVEVASAYTTARYAEEVWSSATPGEKSSLVRSGWIANPDKTFAAHFAATMKKKLEKSSYVPFRQEYGPGYLLVSVQHPYYDDQTLEFMQRAWQAQQVADRGCFKSVYLVIRRFQGYQVTRWRPACNFDASA